MRITLRKAGGILNIRIKPVLARDRKRTESKSCDERKQQTKLPLDVIKSSLAHEPICQNICIKIITMAPFIDNVSEEDSVQTEVSLESFLAETMHIVNPIPPPPAWVADFLLHREEEINPIEVVMRVLRERDIFLADWLSRESHAWQDAGMDYDDDEIEQLLNDDDVPELEEIHHPVSISNVMTTVVENRRSREDNITSTALLPYYIDPMIIGQQDATIVINVREVVRPAAQNAMEFIFPTPTKVNWRYWGLHSTHKERRIRMGLFMGLADNRPMKEDIIHWDGIQVD